MAGMTRTKKYADLRAKLANDAESQGMSEALSKFDDKLKGFEDSFNDKLDEILKPAVEEKKSEQNIPTFEEATKEFRAINENKKPIDFDFLADLDPVNLDKKINSANENNEITEKAEGPTPVNEETPEPVEVIPVIEEPVETFVEEKKEEAVAEPVKVRELDSSKSDDEVSSEVKTQLEEVLSDIAYDHQPLEEMAVKKEEAPSQEEAETSKETSQPKESEDILDSIIDDVTLKEETAELEVEEPVKEVNNEYVNDTLKEVEDYNRSEGYKTIDEIPATMVDAVRHPEDVNRENSDDEFSNTVTLEIDKVLSEIKESPKEETVRSFEEDKTDEAKVEDKVEETFEHPVLTKELEEEKPVEILPMNETLKMDVIDDTIPFMANEETEEEVEDEDTGFSKVINAILIVLIVVLIAILGVIVYYILYAKGIIG